MDIVREIFDRVVAVAAEQGRLNEQIAAEIERQIRQHWGGERVYIAKEGGHGERSDRDATILREWRGGERVDLIAKRHGLSVRRVRQIIHSD